MKRPSASYRKWAREANKANALNVKRATEINMAWRCGPERERECRNCGKAEETDGIVTNLTPYTHLCADCVNRGMKAWVRDINPPGREATKKWKAALKQTGILKD